MRCFIETFSLIAILIDAQKHDKNTGKVHKMKVFLTKFYSVTNIYKVYKYEQRLILKFFGKHYNPICRQKSLIIWRLGKLNKL